MTTEELREGQEFNSYYANGELAGTIKVEKVTDKMILTSNQPRMIAKTTFISYVKNGYYKCTSK